MADLTALVEKRKAYVKEQADKIVNYMVDNNLTHDTLSTCDAPNWDRELHQAMYQIVEELREMGIKASSTVKWGVTDWVFTVITY